MIHSQVGMMMILFTEMTIMIHCLVEQIVMSCMEAGQDSLTGDDGNDTLMGDDSDTLLQMVEMMQYKTPTLQNERDIIDFSNSLKVTVDLRDNNDLVGNVDGDGFGTATGTATGTDLIKDIEDIKALPLMILLRVMLVLILYLVVKVMMFLLLKLLRVLLMR